MSYVLWHMPFGNPWNLIGACVIAPLPRCCQKDRGEVRAKVQPISAGCVCTVISRPSSAPGPCPALLAAGRSREGLMLRPMFFVALITRRVSEKSMFPSRCKGEQMRLPGGSGVEHISRWGAKGSLHCLTHSKRVPCALGGVHRRPKQSYIPGRGASCF